MFARYDFSIPSDKGKVKLGLKLAVNNDKFILDFMRMQIVNKSKAGALLAEDKRTFFTRDTGIQVMEPGNYTLMVEGAMPYATTEG